jgi:uncharacterized protein YlbG (UPF0298 family)
MRIIRVTQNIDEDPEWDYPDSQHDYNPYWDYEHDPDVEEGIKEFVHSYIESLKSSLFPEIGFLENMKAAFVKLNEGEIAAYISGSEPYVVIVVDVNRIKEVLEEIGDSHYLERHLEVTIVHELAHAIQEGVNIELDEDEAEDFARAYVDQGHIQRFWDKGNT